MAYTGPRGDGTTSDPVAAETSDLKAWTVHVEDGRTLEFIDSVIRPATSAGIDVLVVRADMVFGKDHLRSAFYHAKRALRDGSNSSDSLGMETLLYASGERQLSSAIKKMTADERTRELVVAQLSKGDLAVGASWRELRDHPDEIPEERLLRFGIGKLELDSLGKEKGLELVLERVAFVDLLKK